jgi:hypothetical protein
MPDLRKYSRQTVTRLIIGGILLTIVIGGGLIWIIYGTSAMPAALLCIVGGLTPAALIILFFWLIEWIVKRARK